MHTTLRALTGVVFVVLTAASANAQPATDQFGRLADYLRLGDKVILSDAAGRNVTGTVQSLSPESVDVQVAGKPRTVLAGDVSVVRLRKPDSLVNGTLIGAALGAGVGAIWGSSYDDNWINTVGLLAMIGGAVGTGLGAAIDSAIATNVVVYRRPRGAAVGVSVKF